jgi:hypothetical protein
MSRRSISVIGDRRTPSTQLFRGETGGFDDAHTYTVANVWLCLRSREEFESQRLLERAEAVLNNILYVYGWLGS